ncbi:MAG: hypothetical protein K6C32_04685 [Bacilli bacterium]|nr:hypothetical protein [Bacilli bacterium]
MKKRLLIFPIYSCFLTIVILLSAFLPFFIIGLINDNLIPTWLAWYNDFAVHMTIHMAILLPVFLIIIIAFYHPVLFINKKECWIKYNQEGVWLYRKEFIKRRFTVDNISVNYFNDGNIFSKFFNVRSSISITFIEGDKKVFYFHFSKRTAHKIQNYIDRLKAENSQISKQ